MPTRVNAQIADPAIVPVTAPELETIYLMVPKVRQVGYIPFFVNVYKRSEAVLVQEAYVNGVSTRKIDPLAK